ncbi:hypothetical protein QBC34DRAFT_413241 [Podospora aff. communis PSN243]|uniref:Uncharacterized protein n=1 Tax=Podospora aff. communis PSN243 TaxID=3040156 RepID=A0AAV9GBL1_9PEZI|nr:hypothetical protein QBC34DRAFT_413241 [Podospora aff. communis PSN243]
MQDEVDGIDEKFQCARNRLGLPERSSPSPETPDGFHRHLSLCWYNPGADNILHHISSFRGPRLRTDRIPHSPQKIVLVSRHTNGPVWKRLHSIRHVHDRVGCASGQPARRFENARSARAGSDTSRIELDGDIPLVDKGAAGGPARRPGQIGTFVGYHDFDLGSGWVNGGNRDAVLPAELLEWDENRRVGPNLVSVFWWSRLDAGPGGLHVATHGSAVLAISRDGGYLLVPLQCVLGTRR